MSAGRTDSGLYLVKFSNGYVRAKIPQKRPQTPRVLLPGYPRPTRLRKSAHSTLRADTGGITLRHDFFNALLLSRNVHSLKLLLIELLDD